MATLSRTRTVAAPPQSVWEVLADFGAISRWAGFVDHSCLLSPAGDDIGIGTTRRVQVGRNTLVERITEFDPPRSLAYDVQGFSRRLRRLSNRWTLTPAGAGTVVTLSTTIDIGPSRLQDLAAAAIARVSARQLNRMLTGLAQKVQASHV